MRRLSCAVALLVVVASFAPTVSAAACGPNPSGPLIPTAILDAGMGLVAYGGPLVRAAYDLTLTNVSMGALETARVHRPDNSTLGSARGPVFDNAHYARQNFTFPALALDALGNWTIRTASATLITFEVFPGTSVTQGPNCPPGGAMPILQIQVTTQRPLVEFAQTHGVHVRVDNTGNASALQVMIDVTLTVETMSTGARHIATVTLGTIPAGSFKTIDLAWNAFGIVGDVNVLARSRALGAFDRFGGASDFVLVTGQGGYNLVGDGGFLP